MSCLAGHRAGAAGPNSIADAESNRESEPADFGGQSGPRSTRYSSHSICSAIARASSTSIPR